MLRSNLTNRGGVGVVVGRWCLVAGLASGGCGPTGPCPDGFARDNEGNCVEIGDRESEGEDGGPPSGVGSEGSVSVGQGGGATLHVVNFSGDDVWYVYAYPCGSVYGWDVSPDQYPLPDGWGYAVEGFEPGCYDLLAEDLWGPNWVSYGVNLRNEFTWYLY